MASSSCLVGRVRALPAFRPPVPPCVGTDQCPGLRTGTTNAGTVDVLAVMNWLRTQGWWGDVTVGQIQFGFELTGTAGQANFTNNSFSLDYS